MSVKFSFTSKKSYYNDYVAIISLLFIFSIFIVFSWQKYLSPFSEAGRDIYTAYQILQGKVLYRDVYWFYGPFSPYWLALLYKLFDVNLNVVYISGLVNVGVGILLSYFIARCLSDVLSSFVIAFIFLMGCVIPGDYVVPSCFNALYGIIFGLAFLLALIFYFKTMEGGYLVVAGLAAGLCALTKVEFAVAPFLTILFVGGAKWCFGDRPTVSKLFLFFIPALLVPLIAYGFLLQSVSFYRLLDIIKAEIIYSRSWDVSAAEIGIWINVIACCVIFVAITMSLIYLSRMKVHGNRSAVFKWMPFLLGITVILLLPYSVLTNRIRLSLREAHWNIMLAVMPLLLCIFFIGAWRFWRSRKKGRTPEWQEWAYATLIVFCISANVRMISSGMVPHNPFFYAIPTVVVMLIVLKLLHAKKLYSNILTFCVMVYCLVFFTVYIRHLNNDITFKLLYKRGTIITNPVWGGLFHAIMDGVDHDARGEGSIFTATAYTGGLIYYLAEKNNPTPFNQLYYSVCRMVENNYEQFANIDFILLDHKLSTFGFASNFMPCETFVSWVQRNYVLMQSYKATGYDQTQYDFGWYEKR